MVPEGIRVPRVLALKRTADAADAAFEHAGVKAVRARAKSKPRIDAQTAIAEDWEPPAGEVEKLRAECPSVNFDHELAQLRDFYIGKGQRMKDWTAVWRRWVRATHARNIEKGWKPSHVAAARDESRLERWCRQRGITVDEFERRKDEPGWLDKMKSQGIV